MLHGADSPGGGFQGGVIAGSVIMMAAFAFGIDATREWVDARAIVGLTSLGVLTFAGIGLGAMALDGAFLQYDVYAPFIPTPASTASNWSNSPSGASWPASSSASSSSSRPGSATPTEVRRRDRRS